MRELCSNCGQEVPVIPKVKFGDKVWATDPSGKRNLACVYYAGSVKGGRLSVIFVTGTHAGATLYPHPQDVQVVHGYIHVNSEPHPALYY